MTKILDGVRILEVAEHTFVPAASALLSDWGADVIKIEHVERGDAMRGLASTGMAAIAGDVHALLEHSNRGKRSLALDLTSPDGLDILHKLAVTSDVFLTNKLPSVRGFGDSIGAMTIAGGIMGALFHRERTGEATVVDVSLFGTGLWAMGQAMALSKLLDQPWAAPPQEALAANPLVASYETKDRRYVALTCLQAGKYWAPLCDIIGRPDLATDPRFADHASLLANGREAVEILTEVFAGATVEEWRERLEPFIGQWTIVQHTLEAAADPQTVANGYLQECSTASGSPFTLVTAPVQYDEQPAQPRRAPEFNEHGEEILTEMGLDWDAIIDLKVRGIVA